MRFTLGMLAASGLLVLAGCKHEAPVAVKADSGPIAIRTALVKTRQVQRTVESVGTLFPSDEVIISAEIEGPVDQVMFDLGDNVRKDQILAHISDEEQRYILQQNEAQLRQSMERLGLKNEKDRVQDLDQTPEVRRAKADLLEAEQRYKRIRNLVDQKIGAAADLDQASARFAAMQAGYDSSRYQARNLIQEVERYKAIVELQRKKLRDTNVRAPFDASVKERQVTKGQFVRPNTPLFVLVVNNPVRLRLEVPERMAPWTLVGQVAEVAMEAFPNRLFTGRVSRIAPTVDQAKRTFIVEALIENPIGELKPGSYARARLKTRKIDEVRLIPAEAVNYVLGSNKAYVVKDGTVEAREVKVGDRFEEQIEILEGLKDDEQVATTQLNRLDTGVKVRVETGEKSKAPE